MGIRFTRRPKGTSPPGRHPGPSEAIVGVICLLQCTVLLISPLSAQAPGEIEIDFVDQHTEQPIPCRLEILAPDGQPLRVRGSLYHRGWNLIDGRLEFRARPGDYTYRAVHGPQYSAVTGGFTLDKRSEGLDVVRLPRHCDLASEGWLAGDLMSLQLVEQTKPWLAAEDLDMAVVVSDGPRPLEGPLVSDGRWTEHSSFRDSRPGSGLILHHWMPPTAVPQMLPSSRLLVLAKQPSADADRLPVHAEIQRLWARDVPVWLASGLIDSIQVLSEHVTLDSIGAAPATPPIDPAPGRFRGSTAAGRTVEYLYWQVLESGLRIPPTAGSGFGTGRTPLGHNRLYALAEDRSPAGWWLAVRQGRTFITNGPLLRVAINGQAPGSLFDVAAGDKLQLDIDVKLTVAEPVDYLDVIFNGQALYQARLDEHARRGGKIPPLSIDQSGWLVVRVVTQRELSYGLASTAPWYIEVGGRPRISRSAVDMFARWLESAAAEVNDIGGDTASAAMPYIEAARDFWQRRRDAANAD